MSDIASTDDAPTRAAQAHGRIERLLGFALCGVAIAAVAGRQAHLLLGDVPGSAELVALATEADALFLRWRAGDFGLYSHTANGGGPALLFTPPLPTLLAIALRTVMAPFRAVQTLAYATALLLPLSAFVGSAHALRHSALRFTIAGAAALMCALLHAPATVGINDELLFRYGLIRVSLGVSLSTLFAGGLCACAASDASVSPRRAFYLAMLLATLLLTEPILVVGALWGVLLVLVHQRDHTRALLGIVGVSALFTCWYWLPASLAFQYHAGGAVRVALGALPTIAELNPFALDDGRWPLLSLLAAVGAVLLSYAVPPVRWLYAWVLLCMASAWWLDGRVPDDIFAAGRLVAPAMVVCATVAAGAAVLGVAALRARFRDARPVVVVVAMALVVAVGAMAQGRRHTTPARSDLQAIDPVAYTHAIDVADAMRASTRNVRLATIGPINEAARHLAAWLAGSTLLWSNVGDSIENAPSAWMGHPTHVMRFAELFGVSHVWSSWPIDAPGCIADVAPHLYAQQGARRLFVAAAGNNHVGDLHQHRDVVRTWLETSDLRALPVYTRSHERAPLQTVGAEAAWIVDSSIDGSEIRARVTAAASTLLVVRTGASPFFDATIDGAPTAVWRVGPDFPAVVVPAGGHDVKFVHRRPLWWWLLFWSAPLHVLWLLPATRVRTNRSAAH